MTKSEDVRLSFKHYSKLTCENQERVYSFLIFSYLLASVIEIWQDVTVPKYAEIYAEIIESQSCIYGSASENQEDSIYAFTIGNCKKLYRSRNP